MRLYNQNIWGNFGRENKIANRNALIASLIKKYAPDVCSFQECNPLTSRSGEQAIQLLLNEDFQEACSSYADENFTPVFYRRSILRSVDEGYFCFDGLNDRNSKSVTWVILEEKGTFKRAGFVCVHFWWKWGSEKDNLQRLENAGCVAELCRKLSKKYDVPIIVSGDLNSGRNSHQGEGAYKEMLRLGMTDVRYLASVSTDSDTAHTYPVLNSDNLYFDGGLPYKTLDYIFTYGKAIGSADAFCVLTEREALDSSDHCPLLFDFDI